MSNRAGLLVFMAVLSACGFHLRGSELSSSISSAYVAAPRGVEMTRSIRETLADAGIDVVENRASASVIISLLDAAEERRTVSVTEDIRTAEYELTLRLRYRVEDHAGRELAPDSWAVASRIYQLERENLVASHQEEVLIERELKRELVQQILRSIEAGLRAAEPA